MKSLLAGGNLSAIALGTDGTISKSTADGGGVLNIGASTATADDSPTVQAGLGSHNGQFAATPPSRHCVRATETSTWRGAGGRDSGRHVVGRGLLHASQANGRRNGLKSEERSASWPTTITIN